MNIDDLNLTEKEKAFFREQQDEQRAYLRELEDEQKAIIISYRNHFINGTLHLIIDILKDRWNDCFDFIYKQCMHYEYQTHFSPLVIYEKLIYPKRWKRRKHIFPDALELDFINQEYEGLIYWKKYIENSDPNFNRVGYSTQVRPEIYLINGKLTHHSRYIKNNEVIKSNYVHVENLINDRNKEKLISSIHAKLKFLEEKRSHLSGIKEEITAVGLPPQPSPLNEDGEILEVNGLPPLNLAERYFLLEESSLMVNELFKLETKKENKNKLLAILLGCSIDNAKKLLNGTYRPLNNITQERKNELKTIFKNLTTSY